MTWPCFALARGSVEPFPFFVSEAISAQKDGSKKVVASDSFKIQPAIKEAGDRFLTGMCISIDVSFLKQAGAHQDLLENIPVLFGQWQKWRSHRAAIIAQEIHRGLQARDAEAGGHSRIGFNERQLDGAGPG